MKVFRGIVKALVALAAVAGAIYALATYGEQIVAWCKKILDKVNGCCCCGDTCCCESTAEEVISAEVNPPEDAPADESDFEEAE